MRNTLIHLAALMMLMLVGAGPALAGQTEADGTPIDPLVCRSFEGNWRKYARFACQTEGGYMFIPNYDRRMDSSRGITESQAMQSLTVEREERTGNLVQKKIKSPPREDAQALARALPSLRVGSYGYLAAAEVVQVINQDQMIVKELWLVDRDKLRKQYEEDQKQMAQRNDGEVNHDLLKFNYATRIKQMQQQEDGDEGFTDAVRLVGYDTRGLRAGDRWKGPNDEGFQVGVVRWEQPQAQDYDNGRRKRNEDPRLVLSRIEEPMRTTLDEEGFKKMLAERGMTVVEFVDLVRSLREKDRDNAEDRILNALLPEELDRDDF